MQTNEIPINAYTIKGFCRAFGIGRSLAYAEITAGRLRIRKAGRRTLVLKVDADAWANSLPMRAGGTHDA